MRLDWSEVDALVVGGVERAGFFVFEGEIAEALAGAHFSWAQDQVIELVPNSNVWILVGYMVCSR